MLKILVAEDEIRLCEIYQKFLTNAGYYVEIVNDANQTLEKLYYSNDFDLLITDLNMPIWDASYSLLELQNKPEKMKIIVISGFLENSDFEDILAMNKNIIATFKKPIDINELLNFLKTNFPNK